MYANAERMIFLKTIQKQFIPEADLSIIILTSETTELVLQNAWDMKTRMFFKKRGLGRSYNGAFTAQTMFTVWKNVLTRQHN